MAVSCRLIRGSKTGIMGFENNPVPGHEIRLSGTYRTHLHIIIWMPRITPTLLSPALLPSGIPVVLLLALLGTCQLAPVSAGLPENTTARYIVVFHDDVEVDTVADELAGRFSLAVHFRYRHALRGMAVSMPPELLERLSADPRVAYIEPDVVMSAAAQALPTGIDRVNAELDPVAAIDNVDDRVNADIAILDTGIDLYHPDLNVFRFTNCVNTQSRCRDGDSNADDVFGHGTHVAGIAAALDNNSGVVGVAPGARLWAVKVLDDNGDGYESQIVAGVDYVTQYAGEIEVANMSLTGPGFSQALYDAISASVAAGVVYTLAAGNKGADVAGYFPAGHPEAISPRGLRWPTGGCLRECRGRHLRRLQQLRSRSRHHGARQSHSFDRARRRAGQEKRYQHGGASRGRRRRALPGALSRRHPRRCPERSARFR
jgi:hypothetical protein